MKTRLIEKKTTKIISLRVRENDYADILNAANKEGNSVSTFVRNAVQYYLASLDK